MLEIKDLSFTYRKGERKIFGGLSLELKPGRIYGLLGRNGSGKSTLLYLMSGLLMPQVGSITMQGVPVGYRRPETLGDIFLVPEEFDLPPVSLVSYVELNAPFYPRFSKEDLVSYLHCFDMDLDLHLGRLSMGQKKKVFMSFALATHTPLLLMDEPTNGLDIPGKSQFRKFVAQGMDDESTMVISTHQVRDIDRTIDHVLMIDEGVLKLDASVEEICNRLAFVESDDAALSRQALYRLPSTKGEYLMLPAAAVEGETPINLELLFGGMLHDFQAVWSHLKKEENR